MVNGGWFMEEADWLRNDMEREMFYSRRGPRAHE